MILCIPLILGCQASQSQNRTQPITEKEALTLAVALANVACMDIYGATPFNISDHSIDSKNGRWHWGDLDIFGVYGFSAKVSFDSYGKNRSVEVFLSTDIRSPTEPE
jgi:hypothetical protein